jgi:hypothetical protein
VLYEMLAGIAPFIGPTPESVVAQRFSHAPRSVRAFRAGVPAHVERVLTQAFALAPADRFSDMKSFSEALVRPGLDDTAPATDPSATTQHPWLRHSTVVKSSAAIALGTTAVLLLASTLGWPIGAGRGVADSVDPGRHEVQVAEFIADSSLHAVASDVDAAIMESLSQWRDTRVTATPSTDASALKALRTVGATDDLGSRSVISGRLTSAGDSVLVTVRRVGFRGATAVFDAQMRTTTTPTRAREDAIRLTRRLFAPPGGADTLYELAPALNRLAAWREHTLGLRAARSWLIPEATVHFARAARASADFAPAQFWSVQLDAIRDPLSASAAWLTRASQLERLTPSLRGRDSILATALVRIARNENATALAALEALAIADATDPVVWLDRGIAQARDSVVVRDERSLTGWRFRSDSRSAYDAFMRATRLDSRIREALPVSQVALLLPYRPATLRVGRGESPDTATYYALPSITRDSVTLLPVPAAEFTRGAIPSTVAQAVAANQRQLSDDLAEWIHTDSTSSDAFRILSELLEVKGDLAGSDPHTSATGAVARAIQLETVEARELELRVAQLRLMLKLERFADVRREAQRLLGDAQRGGVSLPRLLRGVAALIGDRETTATMEFQLSRIPSSDSPAAGDPARLALAYSRFRAYATVGVCSPNAARLLDTLVATIDGTVAPSERAITIDRLAANSAMFAVQCIGASRVASIVAPSIPVNRMIRAIAAGDTITVAREIAHLRQDRSGARPADVTPDYALVEAWVAVQAGDTSAAVKKLDEQVLSLMVLTPRVLDESSTAGAIGRAMLLRSQLATRDPARSTKWAAAAESLLGATRSPPRGTSR